ncbi:MAG: chromosome segregation protein SMC [Myxococcales bacterium]|nr:chromosome segregation protein SMC [Myxococcales bacterium]
MRIKKIEISGFKSFADREVVHVDDHVTAVIGPNGCGKSNIVDAMRWCLGEQRAKHLRGTGMADVIFAGCSTRGPGSAAEVTVTFETGNDVPLAYLNYAEIAVTRRLLRDGTSEYLLNKVPCRLRDVQELMTGTGAGTRGYSIIEQGQVGRIVSSKPEDRRYIIDEAAGITRFKAQKQAAEKKIELTQQNLLRVRDVLGELEGRLGNLRRQAQKAERYKRYRSELRDLDLWMAAHRSLELGLTARVLETRRADLQDQFQALRNALAAHETRGEAARIAASEAEQALSSAQQHVFDLENRVRLGETEEQYRRREQESLHKTATAARAESEVLARSLAALEQELAEVSVQHQAVLAGGDQGQAELVAMLSDTHEELSTRLRHEVHDHDKKRGELARLHAREASLSGQLGARAEGLAELEQRVAGMGGEAELLVIQIERDQKDLEVAVQARDLAAARVAELGERRTVLDREKQELRQKTRAADAALDAARAELQKVRSRVQSLEEIQARYRGCASGVQVVMQHRDELGVVGILADYLAAPAHLEAALSSILGDRVQGVVVPAPEAAARGVALLRHKQEGRTVFLPQRTRETVAPALPDMSGRPGVVGRLIDLIEVPAEHRALAESLLGETLVIETLAHALELWTETPAPLVTLEGDRVEPSGVIVGGSAKGLDSALLQQKREIRELHELAETRAADFEAARKAHHAIVERQAVIDHEREDSEAAVLEAERTRSVRAQEVARVQQEIKHLQQRVEHLTREREKLTQSLGGRRDERARLTEELGVIRDQLPPLEQQVRDAEAAQAELRERQIAVASQLTEAKIALARFEQQRDALAGSVARLTRQVQGEQERRDRLTVSAAESEVRAAQLAAEAEAAAGVREQLLGEHREATEVLQSARAAHDAARLATEEVDLAVRNLRGSFDDQRERLSEVELGLKELQIERTHLTQDIRDRFDTALEEILVDHHHRPLAGPDELARQQELKRVLARMGEVNLTAIEEFEEVSTRVDYLSTQKTDLESAISQLQEAIDKINRTTRDRFTDTFRQVNELFQQIFPRLFSGGKAELKLTDPNDMLGTGVEIVASPPGKQVRSLELLSGGEKALTAVSLIFAIFLCKPSPFCLLDEVDAPLDEANVGRFGAMVQEMAERTQFIIITHNKRTMEIADRLYGVTMEVKGVSKLVSVNMKKAVEMAVA